MALISHRIVGIDPGTYRLGVGCIQKHGNELSLVNAVTIEASIKLSIYDRIAAIIEEMELLLDQFAPKEVAIENPFFAKNAKSAFQLGLARGMAITLCLKRKIKIFEYTPTQVKSTVTGYGRADKAQVKKMVGLSLGRLENMNFDATDALAVALCHAHTHRWAVGKT